MARPSLSSFHSLIGVLAGLSSIAGAVYSAVQHVRPTPTVGQLAAVVREARTDRPLPGATIEILAPDDALVTTLTPAEDGWVRSPLRQGSYRVRASHPQFAAETRPIEVLPGETAEIRFRLARADAASGSASRGARSTPVDAGARAVNRGATAVRRFIHGLGL